jgi:hypothetical protein
MQGRRLTKKARHGLLGLVAGGFSLPPILVEYAIVVADAHEAGRDDVHRVAVITAPILDPQ